MLSYYMVYFLMFLGTIMKLNKQKLLTLMFLEIGMLIVILYFIMTHYCLMFTAQSIIMLSILMVLDSVFGISMLISTSRNSNFNMGSKIIY